MLVVGIDPGTATTGYGFIRETSQGELEAVDFGVILTKAGQPAENRLQEAFECDGLGQSCRVAELELDSLVRLFNRLTGGC